MNNIDAAKETIKITESGAYEVYGRKVVFKPEEHTGVTVYTPEDGAKLLDKYAAIPSGGRSCTIKVVNSDSFEAAHDMDRPFVMNFANAHNPGGGFKLGANAQEEALCRCSTLYASISSQKAVEMYRYNNTHYHLSGASSSLLSRISTSPSLSI